MASLLLWWSPNGAPIDDLIWQQLVARVAHDANKALVPESCIVGHGYRAVAVRTLNSEPEPLCRFPPDVLVLSALRHVLSDGEIKSRRLTEPAAVIRLEPLQHRVTLTRDLLGQRHLVWTRIQSGFLIATREESLLAHPQVSRRWNEDHIAAMLVPSAPEDTSTPFLNIHAVAAGMTVVLTPDNVRTYREPCEPCEDVARLSNAQKATRFRELLESSVERAATGASRIGIALSAGLDAASIAAILMRQNSGISPPIAITYGYESADGAHVDEREPVRRLCNELGLELDCLDASTIPLSLTLDTGWTSPIGSVLGNAYRELKSELYRRLAEHQVDVMLAGHGADQLATMAPNWIWSAWKDGDYAWIRNGLGEYMTTLGASRTLRHPSIRRFIKYLVLGKRGILAQRAPKEIPGARETQWLTTKSTNIQRLSTWPDPSRAEVHFNAFESWDYAIESLSAEAFGLDIRCPYRDWQLVQFVLSTPLHLMAGAHGYKWLQKQAVRPYLSEDWINRRKCGSLYPLLESAYASRKAEARERIKRLLSLQLNLTEIPANIDRLVDTDIYRSTNLVHFHSWTQTHWHQSGQGQLAE